jgi:antitoxin (DNA-binding transcriptional repressor) of toxin-antitoxin stability system
MYAGQEDDMQINMHEAKSKLSALAEKAWEGETVVIAKAGKPYIDILPHRGNKIQRKPGRFKGKIHIDDDFDQTPEDVIDAFEGNS